MRIKCCAGDGARTYARLDWCGDAWFGERHRDGAEWRRGDVSETRAWEMDRGLNMVCVCICVL